MRTIDLETLIDDLERAAGYSVGTIARDVYIMRLQKYCCCLFIYWGEMRGARAQFSCGASHSQHHRPYTKAQLRAMVHQIHSLLPFLKERSKKIICQHYGY